MNKYLECPHLEKLLLNLSYGLQMAWGEKLSTSESKLLNLMDEREWISRKSEAISYIQAYGKSTNFNFHCDKQPKHSGSFKENSRTDLNQNQETVPQRVLGLKWFPLEDVLSHRSNLEKNKSRILLIVMLPK